MKALLITLLVLGVILIVSLIAQRVKYGKGVQAPDTSFIGMTVNVSGISFSLLFFWTLLCILG